MWNLVLFIMSNVFNENFDESIYIIYIWINIKQNDMKIHGGL